MKTPHNIQLYRLIIISIFTVFNATVKIVSFVFSLFIYYTENGVKDPRIERAVGVCKKAVAAFSYSWEKRREMGEVQAELGLPPHQLITESPTRWGSRQK